MSSFPVSRYGGFIMGSTRKLMGVGPRIRRWREERGLSQEKLARMCDSSSGATIYRYETERVVPGLAALVKIADALEVPVDALVKDVPREHPPAPEDLSRLISTLEQMSPSERKKAVTVIEATLAALNRVLAD